MLKYITMIMSLAVLGANANCKGSTELGAVNFDKNSSYFDAAGTETLKQLLETQQTSADTGNGYLLLEFAFNRNAGDDELQKYNMWLAERRIERVKSYLINAGFGAMMVSRIRTAVDTESRALALQWCKASDEDQGQMLADASVAEHRL